MGTMQYILALPANGVTNEHLSAVFYTAGGLLSMPQKILFHPGKYKQQDNTLQLRGAFQKSFGQKQTGTRTHEKQLRRAFLRDSTIFRHGKATVQGEKTNGIDKRRSHALQLRRALRKPPAAGH